MQEYIIKIKGSMNIKFNNVRLSIIYNKYKRRNKVNIDK